MKTNATYLLVLALFTTATLRANDGKFEQAMKKNISTLYEARDVDQFQQAVNAFERIAAAEKNRWEPLYYIGYAYVMLANITSDATKKDAYLDKALLAIEKAKPLAPSESELAAMDGFISMIRVTVDPQSRGMMYAPKAMQSFMQANTLNPENPRALALMAQMQFGTAQFFGSSTAESCDNNRRALELFDTYTSPNPLAPVWGRNLAESLAERCK